MNHLKDYRVKPHQPVKLKDYNPDDTAGFKSKEDAVARLQKHLEKITELQDRLYAESRQSLLIVLQGMDSSGKDGTIRKVMSSVNPSSCRVVPFKVPSHFEKAHDFLWRVHHEVPPKGTIAIFNRSHYEDVLVARVHGMVSEKVVDQRFEQIKDFERLLWQTGTRILKFYLHISRDEQKERLQERLNDPRKRWKFNPLDLEERKLGTEYKHAYEEAISKTSTHHAPWHIIPANHKWVRNVLIAKAIVKELEDMDPRYPVVKNLPANLRIK